MALEEVDFAKDGKRTKLVAREVVRVVEGNNRWRGTLPPGSATARPEVAGRHGRRRGGVSRGHPSGLDERGGARPVAGYWAGALTAAPHRHRGTFARSCGRRGRSLAAGARARATSRVRRSLLLVLRHRVHDPTGLFSRSGRRVLPLVPTTRPGGVARTRGYAARSRQVGAVVASFRAGARPLASGRASSARHMRGSWRGPRLRSAPRCATPRPSLAGTWLPACSTAPPADRAHSARRSPGAPLRAVARAGSTSSMSRRRRRGCRLQGPSAAAWC